MLASLSATATVGSITSNVVVNVNAAIVGDGVDSDGDGFSDSFESGVGTDPNSASSTPTGAPITPSAVLALTVSKVSVKLNFAKTGNDSVTFSGTVPVPAGFKPLGAETFFFAGGIVKKLTLTVKGSAVSGGDSVKVALKEKKDVVLAAPTAKFSVSFKKGTFAATLASAGLTNADAKAVKVSVPLSFIFNNTVYQKTQTLSYTAKKGKTGIAK